MWGDILRGDILGDYILGWNDLEESDILNGAHKKEIDILGHGIVGWDNLYRGGYL